MGGGAQQNRVTPSPFGLWTQTWTWTWIVTIFYRYVDNLSFEMTANGSGCSVHAESEADTW